jgi:galactokinase
MNTQTITSTFEEHFGQPAEFVVRAPGRVNLIGEHTDYNDGFVFPCAIDFSITIAGRPRTDRIVRAWSLTYNQLTEFSLDRLEHSEDAAWSNYVRGVAFILQPEGHILKGMDIAIWGNVPLGSGLSSSAAMEVASCLAFEAAGGFHVEPVQRALISQRAEREFVGVQCGIMDQFISALGHASHALFIDTRTLQYEMVPLPGSGVSIVIGNTNKQRGLVDSEYNTRRSECEQAVTILKKSLPRIRALRDVTLEQFHEHENELPEKVCMRARHVITENERVLRSVEALKSGNVKLFGQLMNESHDSLRDDYQVSCNELDIMVDAARTVPGVLGSRMTGAGFGGCTVSLVEEEAVPAFEKIVGEIYRKKANLEPIFYVSRASEGAGRIR